MLALLTLGFLIGLAHAFEADHVAAVSSLISGGKNKRGMVRQGAIWGLGHTLTLFIVSSSVLISGKGISEAFAIGLEGIVGAMLVSLGVHVLYRLHRDRVHFHAHQHEDGSKHLHLHSHADEKTPHNPDNHKHMHPDHNALRALLVGMMHGLAGSAALLLVTAATMDSRVSGLFYIALFGIGSVVGMATMSAAMALPLSYTAKVLTRANGVLQLAIGSVTMLIGLATAANALIALNG